LALSGCGGKTEPVNNGTANVNKAEVHPDKHWYTPWRKSKEEWQNEDEEKARIVAENKERLKNELATADTLLDTWSAKLDEQQNKGNGFVHHEGRTELDPWGNLLKVEYYQVNLKEFMTIRSLGPDGQDGTEDDLVRKKYAMNYPGMFDGLDGTGTLVLIWICSGIISFLLFSGYAYSGKRRNHHKHSPLGMAGALIYCVALAPIAVVTYGISLISSMGGSDFDLDPFDIDIG
jgi:hypothetical protein